jgi:serine protease Do
MQTPSYLRAPRRWSFALLLLAIGFVIGVAVTSGGSGRDETPLQAALTPAVAQAQALIQQNLSTADVAELAMPAVVNISADKIVENQGWVHPFLDDPFFRRFFGPPRDDEQQRAERSLGSGVVISADGYILTNNHVVEKAKSILVSFQNNEEFEAEVVGTDPQTDVALIKIDAKDLPYVRFGDSDALRIGEQVMAVGNPFGLGQTVTLGIVSALGRSIGLIDYEDLIQTDATINPGNSGGALVNMKGELVGMNTAILSRSGGSQGIGFAIPSNMAQMVEESLREHGKVERAWLGVQIQDVDQSMAHYHGLEKPRGVLVSDVNAGTPAEKAGLEEGDIILAVDGTEVNSRNALRNKISLSPVGHKTKLRILRDGKEKDVTVELGVLPDSEALAQGNRRGGEENASGIEGVSVRELTDEYRRMADIPDDVEGVFVFEVEPTSAAAREGLERGDVILEIDKTEVHDLDDYQRLLERDGDKPILLRVMKVGGRGKMFMAIPR